MPVHIKKPLIMEEEQKQGWPRTDQIAATKWKPGQNPGGAGKKHGPNFTTILNKYLNAKLDEATTGRIFAAAPFAVEKELTVRDAVALRLITKALIDCDLSALKELIDRTDGKTPLPIAMETRDFLAGMSHDELKERAKTLNEKVGHTLAAIPDDIS